MSYADLFVGILIILLLLIAAVRILSPDRANRRLYRDAQGKLIAIGDHERGVSGQMRGHGTQTSTPLQLTPGTYRIDFQFEALTRLSLIDTNSDETVLIQSGTGTQALTIAETGTYRLRIEPADERAAWQIAYRRTGSGA